MSVRKNQMKTMMTSRSKPTVIVPIFPFLSVLTLIFITLKLTGYIAWSWWWVLLPLWIGPAVLIVLFVILLILSVIVDYLVRRP
jgi:hypothetical protein